MSKILMNLFKHNSTRLFGRLSTKYPHTGDITHGPKNLYFKFHVYGRINFYRGRTTAGCAPLA